MKTIIDYYTDQVTRHTGVTIEQMRIKNRKPKIVDARYALVYLLRYKTQLIGKEIASHLNKHRSITTHALAVINNDFSNSKKFKWLDHIAPYVEHYTGSQDLLMHICPNCGCQRYYPTTLQNRKTASNSTKAGSS